MFDQDEAVGRLENPQDLLHHGTAGGGGNVMKDANRIAEIENLRSKRQVQPVKLHTGRPGPAGGFEHFSGRIDAADQAEMGREELLHFPESAAQIESGPLVQGCLCPASTAAGSPSSSLRKASDVPTNPIRPEPV